MKYGIDLKKILLIEPPGGYIRLDRCMQSIDSWGGVYRFPLNLSRIAAHLLDQNHIVHFVDLQADKSVDIHHVLMEFNPDLCILSCGFPSMMRDAILASFIKKILPSVHVSTFGVVPTLLEEAFFDSRTWNFPIPFDSVVVGGEPAIGYEFLLNNGLDYSPKLIKADLPKMKSIQTYRARHLFNHSLYKSPFTGENATYIEGTYGCPFKCSFCVVPELYGGHFSKRSPKEIIEEFKFVIERNNINHITLWDEGTTFHKSFLIELCEGLIELKKSNIPAFRDFIWTTRSTTALLDEEIVEKLAYSGLSGITLGLESFDATILETIGKGISFESNQKALRLLHKYGIASIGHIILGHVNDTADSIESTIRHAVESDLNFAQFYCLVPYPGTKLGNFARERDLVRVNDLTQYELCNPIMDTLTGLTHHKIGNYREKAIKLFWDENRWQKIDALINRGTGIAKQKELFFNWKNKQKEVNARLATAVF